MWQRRGISDLIKDRYLLCRPEGGLNDMLSEIGKCVSYGRKFGRAVIVEANSENAAHFKDVFGRYFTSQDANLVLDAKPFVQSFDSMEVLPATLKNQVQHYPLTVAENLLNGNALSFDFLKDYKQQLLVHHSSGQKKGRNAIFALSQVMLKQELVDELKLRLGVLGEHYHAFHIRHTDHKTDYKDRVLAVAPKVKSKIFLGTDNKAVVEFFYDVFGRNRVESFSQLPEVIGKALHYNNTGNDIWIRNRDAIVDLLTLVLADNYSFFSRDSGKSRVFAPYSGYSVLAARLRFSPAVVRQLLPRELHSRIKTPSLNEVFWGLRWRYF